MIKDKDVPDVSTEDLKKALNKKMQDSLEACDKEIELILRKYNATLKAITIIDPPNTYHQIRVVSNSTT